MPTTITSYTSFTANTKAVAADVNNNFNNHRGDLIPINTNTQTASDSSHDLGLSTHRWKDIYGGSLDLLGSTSTVSLQLIPDTSSTAGGWALQAGTTTGKFFSFGSTTTEILNFGSTLAVWDASKINFLLDGGATAAAFNSSGLNGALVQDSTIARTALGAAGWTAAAGTGSLTWVTSTVSSVTGQVITIDAKNASNLIEVMMHIDPTTVAGSASQIGTGSSGNQMRFLRGAVLAAQFGLANSHIYATSSFRFIDSPNTSGSVTYTWQVQASTGWEIRYARIGARIL